MKDTLIKIPLQPKQKKLWDGWEIDRATRNGFGGARGGGKSGAGRRLMLLRRFKYANTTGLILRRTYPELYKSHIIKLFEEYPELRGFWREQTKELILPNGSRLFFGSAEHAKDIGAFYSAEFADIMIDEAQEFSQHEMESLGGSNRSTSNSEITPAMLFTFMPGVGESGLPPIGLDYLTRVFVDGNRRGEELEHKWNWVHAFAWDNIEWARKALGWTKEGNKWAMQSGGITEKEFYSWSHEKRREYFISNTEFGAVLKGLTSKALRDAWLEGKFGAFEGKYFDTFDRELHTVEHASIDIKSWYRFWLSGDWGDYHPACIHLHMEDAQGNVTTLGEVWGRHIGEEALGVRAGKLCDELLPENAVVEGFAFSWDAFGKLNKETQRPITEMVADGLPDFIPYPIPTDSSPGSRISGWRHMQRMINNGKWKISRACTKLIECIPLMVRDMERNTEDVLKQDWSENFIGDDTADCARYGLQYMLAAARKPLELRVQERLAVEVKQPTESLIHYHRILAEEKRKGPRPMAIRRHWRFSGAAR